MTDHVLGSHQPAKWLVVDPNPVLLDCPHEEFNDPTLAKLRAEQLAAENPGMYVDIYLHLTAVRKSDETVSTN